MKATSQTVSYPDLKGSEQHLPLKNRKGEQGKADHAESEEKLKSKTKDAIRASDADTQIAEGLRDLAEKS